MDIYIAPPRVVGYTVRKLEMVLKNNTPTLEFAYEHTLQPTSPEDAASHLSNPHLLILSWHVAYYYPEYQEGRIGRQQAQQLFVHRENLQRLTQLQEAFKADPVRGLQMFESFKSLEAELLSHGWEFAYTAEQTGHHEDPRSLVSYPVIADQIEAKVRWATVAPPTDKTPLPSQGPAVLPEAVQAPGAGEDLVTQITQALLPLIDERIKALVHDHRSYDHHRPGPGQEVGASHEREAPDLSHIYHQE